MQKIQFSAALLLKTLPCACRCMAASFSSHPGESDLFQKTLSNILGWIAQWSAASQANSRASSPGCRRTAGFEVRCRERPKVRVTSRSNKRCSRCQRRRRAGDGEVCWGRLLLPIKATSVGGTLLPTPASRSHLSLRRAAGRPSSLRSTRRISSQTFPKLLTLEHRPLAAPTLGSSGAKEDE